MRIALATLTVAFALPALGQQQVPERVHQWRLCEDLVQELEIADTGRADCVTDTHAIEIDFSAEWKGGLGQALAYGANTGLRPGLILICNQREGTCLGHKLALEQTVAAYRLPVDVWYCLPTDARNEDCQLVEGN